MPVYIIRAGDTGVVKIGFTAGPARRRLAKMQTDNHERLTIIRWLDGDEGTEAAIQRRFAHLRIRGDWFTFSEELLGDIGAADIQEPQPVANEFDGANVSTLVNRAGGVGKLALVCDVSHSTVCDWMRGNFLPGRRLLRISRALDIPIAAMAALIRTPSSRQQAA